MEEWRTIIYQGITYPRYEVSTEGHIRNASTKHQLKGTLNHKGYLIIVCRLEYLGKKVGVILHRAIAETFLPNPNSLPQVNHLDGNKTNNTIENLEWCTPSENTRHSFQIGLRNMSYCTGSNCNTSKLTEEQVIQIRQLYKEGKTIKEIHSLFNHVCYSTIKNVVHNRWWKHIGD